MIGTKVQRIQLAYLPHHWIVAQAIQENTSAKFGQKESLILLRAEARLRFKFIGASDSLASDFSDNSIIAILLHSVNNLINMAHESTEIASAPLSSEFKGIRQSHN